MMGTDIPLQIPRGGSRPEMSSGTSTFVPPTPRGMEKFMQLYYDEESEDETEGSTPDHPDQANLKNPGLSLSPEEILQLAGSLQPAYATQEPENYNPEWPSCSPNPEPQTAHKGPEYLETNALLPGPINTCGTLTTTGTHQDIKPLKVANEWNPVSLEMSSTPLSQKTTPHLENEDGTNAEDDTRLAHQFGKNEDTRLPSADHPNGGAYEPAAPKRQAVHAQPDTPLKLPPNSTSPAADVAPGGVETEASGCDPNGIAAEGGPQQAGGVEQGAKGTVSENVRQATRPAADAAPDGAETEASGCKQNGVAADGGAQLTGAACSTGSTGCTQAGAELSSGSITLYGDATSSEALPIIALLSETATPYSLVSPELLEAEVSKLAITHKTSLGGPPVLDDDGYKVWGTTTILRYVCGKLDLDSWLPCDLETRGLCDNALEFWSSSFLDFANKVLYPAVGLMEPLSPEKAQSTQTSFTSDIWPAMQHLLNKGSGDVLGGKSANISDLCFVIYLELICAVLPDHYVSKHEGVKKYVSGVRHRVPAIQPLLKAAVDFHIKMKQKHDQDYQETARTEAIQTQVKGQAVTSVDPLAPMSTDQGQSSPRTESESTSPEGLPAPAAARRAAEERAAAEAAAAAVAKQAKLEAARREAEERETAEAAAENETSRREAEKRAAAEAAAAAVKQAKEEEAAETLRLEADGGAAPQGAETMNSLGGEMAATYTPTLAADAAVARMKAEKGVAAEISRSAEGRLRLADSIPAAAMPEGNNIPAAENGGSSREIQTLEECASLHAETSISSLNREGEWMMSLVSTGDQRVITDALANSSSPVSVAATEEFQDDKGDFEDIDGLADINDDVFDDDEDNDWTMKQQIRFAVAAGDWNEALQLSDMMESAQKCKEDIEEVMDEVQLRNLIQDALQAEDFEAVASLSRKMSAVKAEGQLREQVAEALKQGDWAQASRLSTQLARSSDSRRQDASSSRSLNLTPVAYGHALHPPPASSRPYHSAPRQRAVASWQENAPESKRAAQHADTRKSAALSSASHKPGHDLANKASQEGSAQVKRESEERAAAEAAAAAAAKQAEAEAVAEARREAEERAAAVAAVAAKQAEAEAAEAMKRGAEERATAAAAAAAELANEAARRREEEERAAAAAELANEAARREAEERAAAVVAAAAKQAEEDATEAARREARERAAAEIAGACTSGLIRKVAEDLEAFGAREGEKKPTAAKAEVEPSEQAPADTPVNRHEEQASADTAARREAEERAAAVAAAAAKQAEEDATEAARREARERAAAEIAGACTSGLIRKVAEDLEAFGAREGEKKPTAAKAEVEPSEQAPADTPVNRHEEQAAADTAARREAEERAAAVAAVAAKQAEEDATEAARREARERAAAEIAGACTSGLIRKVAEDLEAFGAREGEKKPTAAKAEVEPSEQAPADTPVNRHEEQAAADTAARREAEERAAAVAAAAAKQAEEDATEAARREASAAKAEVEPSEQAPADTPVNRHEEQASADTAARREAEERAAAVAAAAAKQAEEDATEAARREARERAAAEIAGACMSGLIRKVAEDLEAFGAREGEKKPTAAKAEVEPSEQAPAANPATSKRNEEQGAVARVSISKSVLIELTLDMCFQTVMDLRAAFSAELVQDLARALGTSPENIKVERIRAGSVIVDVTLEQGLFNVDTDDMVAFEMLIKQLYDSKSILKQGLHTRNVVAIRLMNATAAGPAAPADVATIFDAAGLEVNQVVEIAEDKKAIALLATMEDIAKAAACPPATTLAENDVHVLTEAEMKAKDFRKKMKEKRKSLVKSGSRTPSITHSAGSSVCDDDSQACSPGAAVGKSSKSGMVQVVVAKKEKEPRGKGSEKNLSANQIRDYTELEEPEHFDHEEGDRSDDNEMENDYTEEELQVMASKVWIWLRQIPHHSEFVQNSFVKPQKSSAPETQQEVVVGNVEQKLQTKTELESSQQWQVVRDQALLMVRGKIERDGIQEEPWMKQLRHEAIDFVHALEGDLKDLREDLGDDELATSDKYNPRSLFLLPLDSMFRRGIIAIVEQPFVNYFILFVILANVVTMALEDPLVSEQSEANRILGILSIVFIAIFALEAALKVIAYGVLLGPHAYLKNPWNCLDFFIVVTGLLDVLDAAVVGGESNRVFSSLRLLRPLRIIRAVEHFEELRVLVALILSCAAQMVHALGLVSVILLTFGIAGNLIWRGSLRGRCYHRVQGNIIANADEQICSITGETGLGKCPPEYQCIQLANNPFPGVVHFDNVYMSIISTFLLLSAQGWGELMWDLESGFAGASNPIVILLIFTGHLFLLKLILVVLTNKYAAVKLVKTNEFNSMSLFELRVGIIEAQDLPRMDLFGASDAYIQMQLGRKTKKTKVLKNTLHPRWYEHYVLPVEKTTSLLTLRMFDWNRIGAHDFMGQVVIPVGNCDEHESGSDRWYEMTEEDTGAACGIVRVQLQWRKSKKSVWSRLPTVQIECTESMEEFQAENVIMSSILKMFSRIASSQTLVFVMIGVVIMNVIVMGAEHECGEYSYCLDFQYVTEVLNVVFAIMFAIEMLIKIVGVGLVNYCKDSGNMVYVFVVAAGIAEIPFILMVLACLEEKRGTLTDAYACEANILGIVRLFRLVRLLRIGRLLEFFPQLNMQLTVMARTVKAVSSLIVLLAMIVAIFAILGSNLFASKSMEAIDSVNTEGDSNFARGSMVRFILPYSRRDPSWNRTLLTGRMMEANTTYEPHRFLVKQHGTDAQYWALLQYGITGDSGLNELSKTIHSPLIVGLVPRSNFDNFPNAVITTFQVLTLARWNQVWYSCTSSPGGAVPFIYFLCLIVIGNFFFFNLFTAIIIQAFAEQRQEMDEQIKEQLALESETEEAGNPDFTLRLSSGDIGALSRDTSSRFSSVVVTSFSSIINFFMRSRKVAPEGGGQVTQSESSKSSPESLGHDRAFVKLICTFFAVADNLILIIFQGLLVTHDAGLENQIIRISTTVCLGIGAVDLVRRCRTRQSITDSFNIMDAIVMLAALPELLFLWTDGQVLFAEAAFLFFRALRPLRVVLVLGNLRKFVRQIKDSAKPLRNAALIVFFGFLVMGIFGVTELAGKMNFCSDSLVHSRSQCIGFSDTGEARVWKKPALNYDWIGQAIATMFAIALRDRWTELMYQAVDTTGNRDEGQFRDYSPWYILLYFAVLFVGGFFLLNIFAGVVVDTHCLSLRKRKAKALQNHQIIAKIPDDGRQNAWLKMVNNWKIDIFMLCIIMLDIITMSCESYKASRSMIAFVSGANFFFTFVYAAEAQVKIYAMKAAKYFSNPWCRFEFAILLLTVWGVSVEKMDAFSDSVGGSDTIAPGLAAYFRIFRSVRVLRAFRLFNLQAAKSFRDLLSSLSNAAAQISEVFAILCIIYIIFGNVTVGIFGNMCDRSAPGGDPFISSESDAGLVPRCLLVDEDAKPPGIVVSNVGRALVTLLSISTADTWTRVLKYLSLSPGVRKSGENAVPQARIQLMRYLQTREINYLYEARALLPGCQAADELNALSDVVDCSSKAGHACMSTCGNMTIAYLLCNVFICLTTLIILNLLLAVLLESLQDHQETVASSNPNGTQDGGSVSRLINISRAASSWRRGSTATFVEAQHAQDDEDDDTPKFVGVSPLPRSRATQSPQRSPLGSPLPSPSKVDGFVRRLRGTAKMRSSIEDEFRGDSGGRSSVSSRGSVRMGQLPSPTK